MLAVPFCQTSNKLDLPFKTWLPYSIETRWSYWLSFGHQFLGLLCCASVSVANDTIVTGFMMQACAQFEILEHRFKLLPRLVEKAKSQMTDNEVDKCEENILKQYVQHHNHIYEYLGNVMDIFNSIIFVQFCASAMVITVSVYQLSMKNPSSFDFIMVLLYLMSMLTEFFMYCWFGNEVTIKSIQFAKNIYLSDWTTLNVKSWKMMIFVIHRTSKPVIISCYNWVFLSLDTYVQILKLSYSAFNILRRSAINQ
ncbi:odorant receptor Or1-like [Phymastichus coffea]|uniref:odorant receptor Or1-like n=1 Tax=Phymastichus coffea TaxID=108790 RepID=UPI00273CE947|nr:odorant receptor Or1-like [Phymastichus coffea]